MSPSVPSPSAQRQRRPNAGRRLTVLLVEDNPADAELLAARLEDGGFEVELTRVTTHAEFNHALVDCRYDCILSDYRVPGFDGTAALGAAKLACPDIPFLFVSGALGEEKAIELLKRGATDYVLKDRLERLVPSVERALQEAQERVERRRAEERLRHSEARLSTVVSALAEGVILADASGTYQLVNASAQRILGLSRDGLVGQAGPAPLLEIYREDGTRCPDDALPSAHVRRTGQPELGRVLGVQRPDGTRVWLSINAQPLFDEDGATPAGVVISFSDVTLRRQQAEFEQQLVGIVSHDLRNPISAMMMSANALMMREESDPRTAKGLARIVKSGERALRLIRDLLDFTQARLGSGIPIRRQPLNLHHVVESVVEEVRSAHPDREIRFEPQGGANGEWDVDRLSQICSNLLTNAVAYSPEGSVIRVQSLGQEDCARLEVQNQGDPIPPPLLASIFEPFRRGRELRHSQAGNIGLGLFIVQQLVRSHAGAIEVQSSAESGTVFRVRLPKQPPSSGPAQPV